ncbi:hypothetical protein PENSTE_c024G00946 [Penicillium steckii]|uniref:Zn(2)-C6 fungal-type domain-containing protein n=1 Tax=Penicillium steckii TaxID=303698 RepID=A0A1V6SS57_9EURO|nr:hypothetical protein PENSTE_c024G00946 [Penicillium steckii]
MGDGGRNFRPIAPRSIPLVGGGGGGGGEKSPAGGASGIPEEGKMKRASTACKECQKRRTRCTGMPCSECVTHGRECITDELSDKRRKASARRTQEELVDLRGFVDQILTVLRISDPATLQHLIQTIRAAGENYDEIRGVVTQILHSHSRTPQSSDPNLHQSPQIPQIPQIPHPEMDPNMVDPSMRHYYNPNQQ